jgi:hypothetical protein
VTEVVAFRASAPPRPNASARALPRPVTGEKLAVGSAAAAVALMPLLVPGGPSNLAPVDLFILAALLAAMLWTSFSGHRWRFPYLAAIGVFIAGGAVGALRGPVPGAGAIALVQDVLLLLWCWTLVNVASSAERLGTIARTWAYSSVVWAVLLLAGLATGTTVLTGQTAREGSRTSLTFVDPNISANYWVLSLMVIWATGRPRHRGWRAFAYAGLLVGIGSSGSSGGLISLVVAVAVAGCLGLYRRAGIVPALTAAALGSLVFLAVASQVSLTNIESRAAGSKYAFIRDGIGRGAQSEEFRGALLRESGGLYLSSGALGAGPVSTKVRLNQEQAPVVKEAHDDYLAALLERGALGLAGLLLLLASVGVRGLGVSAGRLSPAFDAVVVRPNALLGAAAGTFVAASVYEVLHVRHVWALFALIAALSIWGRE